MIINCIQNRLNKDKQTKIKIYYTIHIYIIKVIK